MNRESTFWHGREQYVLMIICYYDKVIGKYQDFMYVDKFD